MPSPSIEPAPPAPPWAGPRVLALDTSTERMALALNAPGGPWRVLAEGGAKASATLLPEATALLRRAGLAWAELDFIAFGQGPGAFTGLRTACAVAQGLGFGLGRPLLAIDSLLIVAEDARGAGAAPLPEEFEIGVAMDARMDEAYAASYRWRGGAWQVQQAPALFTLPALAQAWSARALHAVAGSALAAFGERLACPASALRFEAEHDRAGALLRLAVAAAQAGQGMDAAAALPLYLRDKVALTTEERAAAKAAAT